MDFYKKKFFSAGQAITRILILILIGCNLRKSVLNPEITQIDSSSATIAWRSNEPHKGRIYYHPAGKNDKPQTVSESFGHSHCHEVHIDGLESGTQYIYWIGDTEQKYFFRTAPDAVKPFSFLIESADLSDRMANLLMSELPDFVLTFSKEKQTAEDDHKAVTPYVPAYTLNGKKTNYLETKNRKNSGLLSWKLDWGGLCLIFIEVPSDLHKFFHSPVAHTIGVVLGKKDGDYSEQVLLDSALHQIITGYNEYYPSNKITFVLRPRRELPAKEVELVSIVVDPENNDTLQEMVTPSIKISYAVLLDRSQIVMKKFNVNSFPTTLIIGQKGDLVLKKSGYDSVTMTFIKTC